MKRRLLVVLMVGIHGLAIGFAPPLARGDLVVDLDPFTAGYQSSLSVLSGASVTLITYYDPTLSGPLAYNAVGVDLNWTGLGLGTATPTTPALMGTLGSVGPFVVDIVSGAPIAAGSPLLSAGLPPVGAFSLGGVGFVDTSGSFFTLGGPALFPVDLFGVTFTITGGIGDSVTFMPTGMLAPPTGSSPVAGPFVPGGHPYQVGTTAPTISIPEAALFGGTITIIPEPRVATFVALGLALLSLLRRPERAGRTGGVES